MTSDSGTESVKNTPVPSDAQLEKHLQLEEELGLARRSEVSLGTYFTPLGEPALLPAAVLFLDLLGTQGNRSDSDALEHLRVTHRAIRQVSAWSTATDKKQDGAIYSFSDNIGLGHATHGPVDELMATAYTIIDSAYLQLAFLLHGLFSRGAVAYDLFFADPDLEFLHGPALNRAVNLEKSRAVYPRVVLDEASIAIVRAGLTADEQEGELSEWRDQLLVDGDGVVFVNYLHTLLEEVLPDAPAPAEFLPQHREYIHTNLRKFDGIPGVEEKYRWVASYHDFFATTFCADLIEEQGPELLVGCSRPIGKFRRFGDDLDK